MPLNVELDIFSGMPNPRWTMDSVEAQTLLQQILDESAPIVPVHVVEDKLGYRGYIVDATGAEAETLTMYGKPTSFRVRRGLDGSGTTTAESELLLAGLDMEALDLVVMEGVLSEVAAPTSTACSLLYTSSSNFAFWNGERKTKNNCYNYAANYASNTNLPGTAYDGRALPGRASGAPMQTLTKGEMTRALKSDGWKLECEGSNLRVMAYIWPDLDFHLYRKNLNADYESRWCHKPGHTAAKNKDESGNVITYPPNANRGGYTQLVGTFFSGTGKRSVVVL